MDPMRKEKKKRTNIIKLKKQHFWDEKGKRHDCLCENMGFGTLFEGRNLKLNLFFVTKLQQTKCSIMNSFPLKPEHSTLGILAHSVTAIQFSALTVRFQFSETWRLALCEGRYSSTDTQRYSSQQRKFSHSLWLITVATVFILGHLQLSELHEITT